MKIFKRILLGILFFAVAGAAVAAAFNYYVVRSAEEYIFDRKNYADFQADYILVLGAAVKPGGELSDMLSDRVYTAAELYRRGVAPVVLMSADSEDPDDYDEISPMIACATENGVLREAIVSDPMGLSTYDSIVRAREQMTGSRVIIVTQKYHLYRAVYIARELGLDAYGCDSALRDYGNGQLWYTAREWAARIKDVFYVRQDRAPAYGTEISIQKYNVTEK